MALQRKILIVPLVGVIALAMTACGSNATSDSGPASAGGGGATTITFWNSYTASDRPFVEELVQRFNDSQDDFTVDMTIQPNDVLTDTLLPAYQAKQGPTLVTLDASLVPSFVEQGVLQPVDDFYGGSGMDPSTLPAASLEATTYEGEQYGIPFGATPTMLYWNKTLFAAAGIVGPPTTMDEMADDAVALADADAGQYGIAIADREAPSFWAVLIWANGGGIVSEDRSHSTFGDPESIEAVDRWATLMRNDKISPVGMNGVDGDNLFGAGKAAMLVNGPWVSAGFTEAGLDYGIVPVPAGSEEQTSIAISTNLHLNAAASEDEKEAAYAFATFWNSEESQTFWSVSTGYPPNLSTIDPSALSENPTAEAFAGETNSQFYLGGLKNFSQIDTDQVVPTTQRITAGQGTAAELMPEASDAIDALLED